MIELEVHPSVCVLDRPKPVRPRVGQDRYYHIKARARQGLNSSVGRLIVHGFRNSKEADEAGRLAEQARREGFAILVVASPEVYNQPKVRHLLDAEGLQVVVCAPDRVRTEDLRNWAEVVLQNLPQAPESMRDIETGRLDARKISEVLGISLTDLATKVCSVSKQALSQSPTGKNIQEKLQPLEEIAGALPWFRGDKGKLRAWLQRPNRDFPAIEGKPPAPLDLILKGHGALVARKLQNLMLGHPA